MRLLRLAPYALLGMALAVLLDHALRAAWRRAARTLPRIEAHR